jgi:hypothetical protein
VPSPTLLERSARPGPLRPILHRFASYREILGKLWLLNAGAVPSPARHHRADLDDARQLLAEQARLCDELGADFAAVIGRQCAREWARCMGRCPWCGLTGEFHDPGIPDRRSISR